MACPVCNTVIDGAHKTYCSKKCQNEAYRLRKAAQRAALRTLVPKRPPSARHPWRAGIIGPQP